MKILRKICLGLLLTLPLIGLGQVADSLVSVEDVVFTDGATDTAARVGEIDSLQEVPEDLIFTDGEADSVAQDSVSLSDAGLPADSKPEKQSLWGIFIAGLIG
ncbi:hypothetical protein ACFSSD_14660, partial [Sphingobacterium griseoflavum]